MTGPATMLESARHPRDRGDPATWLVQYAWRKPGAPDSRPRANDEATFIAADGLHA